MAYSEIDFYIPSTVKELRSSLYKFYPDGKFDWMKKKQLLAIYIKARKDGKVYKNNLTKVV